MGVGLSSRHDKEAAGMSNEILFCSQCSKPLLGYYCLCDRSDGQWCGDCFETTPCGKGEHGEGCPTQVFETSEQQA